MNVKVCFIPISFDFSIGEDVLNSIRNASDLIEKMWKHNGLITFSKSTDFDEYAANELFSTSSDVGGILSLLYDHNMTKADILSDMDGNAVRNCVNLSEPIHGDAWMSVYTSESQYSLFIYPDRLISSEDDLVRFCTKVIVENSRDHKEYAKNFIQIYRNIIFLDNPENTNNRTFNQLKKMEGGYQNFIKGITDCLSLMNSYSIIPNDSQKNIEVLNSKLRFSITPEGGGKNKRKVSSLKRDFLIENNNYSDINCEFHYKLERSDTDNKRYYYNRIYFGFFNRLDPKKPKIAIAHIGEHL